MYDDGDRAYDIFCQLFSRVDSAALVSKNHGNCLFVQFCSQQCRAVLHDYHSQPVLMMIYPVLIVLIVLSFGHKWIGRRKMVYIFSMAVAFGIAFINAMEGVGIELGMLTEWAKSFRFMNCILAGCCRRQVEHC